MQQPVQAIFLRPLTDHWSLGSVFQRQFGMSIEAAWRCCHEEYATMASVLPKEMLADNSLS